MPFRTTVLGLSRGVSGQFGVAKQKQDEIDEIIEYWQDIKDTGLEFVSNFLELPSLHDKLLYVSEIIYDYRHALSAIGALSLWKMGCTMLVARKAKKSSILQRALKRGVQSKRLFTDNSHGAHHITH